MTKYALLMISALSLASAPALAGSYSEFDCNDEAYKDDEACLVVLPASEDVNNLVPYLAPAAGVLLLAAALSGGGSSNSTTSTTATTSTTSTGY